MLYKITNYSYNQSNLLRVVIKPSQKSNYKIDLYDNKGKYITSIGSKSYSDYPTYITTHGLEFANQRRKLYKIRHKKDRQIPYSRGWYADKILW